jgi:hypothetical protein
MQRHHPDVEEVTCQGTAGLDGGGAELQSRVSDKPAALGPELKLSVTPNLCTALVLVPHANLVTAY